VLGRKKVKVQLFLFWTNVDNGGRCSFFIPAKTQEEAAAKLKAYLSTHPRLPVYEDWPSPYICGKVGEEIFTPPISW